MRICWLLQRCRLRIAPVFDHRQIEVRPQFLELGEAVLLDQHHCRRQQCAQAEYALQPGERWWIKHRPAQFGREYIGKYPERDKKKTRGKEKRAPHKTT